MRFLSTLLLLSLGACGGAGGEAFTTRDLGDGVVIDVPASWKLEINEVTVGVLGDYPVRLARALVADMTALRVSLDERVKTCTTKAVSETLPSGAIVRACGDRLHVTFPIDAKRAIECISMGKSAPTVDPIADRVCRSLRKKS
ncbi:MAG: hypothetical protein SFX73_32875 [Kofleriaceae bacterium]|nr:hypothetical protein [Kofleriaceae bacterium]